MRKSRQAAAEAPPRDRHAARDRRLKRNRAVATRYDKPTVCCEATVRIAAISEWLRPDFLNSP